MNACVTWRVRLAALLVLLALGPLGSAAAAPAEQTDPSILVGFVGPTAGERVRGNIPITGFAGDKRSQEGSGLNASDVQLYLARPGEPFSERQLLDVPGLWTEQGVRDEAGSCCHPELTTALVFRTRWSTCTFPPGRYTLTAWVSSLVAPGARNRASVDVDVEPCEPGTLLGRDALDNPRYGSTSFTGPGSRSPFFPGIVSSPFADFAAGLDARCVEPDGDCRPAHYVRWEPGPRDRIGFTPTATSYRFEVYPSRGQFRLTYWPPGEGATRFETLGDWTASPAVRGGTDWNRLGIVAEGDRQRYFVNGEQVADVRDDRRPWGRWRWVGLSADRGRTVGFEFRNVVVGTVGPLERLRPILQGQQ